MRTNISNNFIPNNYFIIAKKPIYIDYTSNIFFTKHGVNCNNLELVSNTFTNYSLLNIDLNNSHYLHDKILFNTNYTLQHRITPDIYFITGYWKTKNNDCICDDINDIYVEYPIKIVSPNSIVINNNTYSLQFNILENIFEDNDEIQVYFLPTKQSLTRMFLINSIIFKTNTINYSVDFNTSIFLDSRYIFTDNNYYIALKSKSSGEKFLKNAEKLRNKLAHAQDLVGGSSWFDLISFICLLKNGLGSII
jgi:hypothetical protein